MPPEITTRPATTASSETTAPFEPGLRRSRLPQGEVVFFRIRKESPGSSASKIRRRADALLACVFLAAIVLPSIAWLTGFSRPDIEATENRRAAAFPELAMRRHGPVLLPRKKTLEAFPAGFEAWLNDRLGFRRPLIQSYRLAKSSGWLPSGMAIESSDGGGQNAGRGSRGSVPVLVGRDGWLYYRGDGDLESHRCRHPFTPQELADWEQTLEERRAWLAQRGIRYLVVIAPDKSTIYPEHLPAGVHREGAQSRLDQFLARLRDERGFDILDLRSELREAGQRYPTYFHTDTHWNQYGAFIGYQQIMRSLAKWFPESRPRSLDDFNVEVRTGGAGDEGRLLALPTPPTDTHVELTPRQPNLARRIKAGRNGHKWRVLKCRNAPLARAVVLHDSFFVPVMPFFSEHWQRVNYRWTFEFPRETIERERPQVVVQEIVERFLIARPAARRGEALVAAEPSPDANDAAAHRH